MEELTAKQAQEYADGKRELFEVIGLAPELLEELRGRAQFLLDGGHDERALIMLELIEELDRKDPSPTLLAVDVLLRMGRSGVAEAKVDRLLARHPNDPMALVAKAEVQIAAGELVPAAALLARVIDEDGDGPAARRAKAVAARAHGRVALG